MVESELEQNLKKGVISQKEYDYLIQNRTSALPSYYKSIQFILILGLVPLLQTIIRMFMTHALNSTSILRIDQVIFAGIFFLIYKLLAFLNSYINHLYLLYHFYQEFLQNYSLSFYTFF